MDNELYRMVSNDGFIYIGKPEVYENYKCIVEQYKTVCVSNELIREFEPYKVDNRACPYCGSVIKHTKGE